MHHTDCGTTHFKDAAVRAGLKDRLPDHPEVDGMSFGAIDELVSLSLSILTEENN